MYSNHILNFFRGIWRLASGNRHQVVTPIVDSDGEHLVEVCIFEENGRLSHLGIYFYDLGGYLNYTHQMLDDMSAAASDVRRGHVWEIRQEPGRRGHTLRT